MSSTPQPPLLALVHWSPGHGEEKDLEGLQAVGVSMVGKAQTLGRVGAVEGHRRRTGGGGRGKDLGRWGRGANGAVPLPSLGGKKKNKTRRGVDSSLPPQKGKNDELHWGTSRSRAGEAQTGPSRGGRGEDSSRSTSLRGEENEYLNLN